jgi:hypothetical protein
MTTSNCRGIMMTHPTHFNPKSRNNVGVVSTVTPQINNIADHVVYQQLEVQISSKKTWSIRKS